MLPALVVSGVHSDAFPYEISDEKYNNNYKDSYKE